jgi:uncharacterized membrane protein
MNEAHLHMVFNHFPIIGTLFGLGILVFGFFTKNNTLKNTAYILFIIAAVFGFLSMSTGEGAEELVEDLPNVGHDIIHEHEEIAEKFILFMYATGIFSILALFTSVKKHIFAKMTSIITLLLAIVTFALATKVGTTGGEVRHTEIRTSNTPVAEDAD